MIVAARSIRRDPAVFTPQADKAVGMNQSQNAG